MLSDEAKAALRNELKIKKGIQLRKNSFINMKPNHINCTAELTDAGRTYFLRGSVKSFLKSPFEIQFKYALNSAEKKLFQKYAEKKEKIDIDCRIAVKLKKRMCSPFQLSKAIR